MPTPSRPDRPGQRFHDFVAMLERMLAGHEGVSVASPCRLRDRDTGRLREHDVVITRDTHHGTSFTALECRDHSRPVGVPQIEGFAKKCERTGIHHGIVVSSSGFAGSALLKAKALNLTCLTLAEAERLDWIGDVTVKCQFSNFRSIEVTIGLADAGAVPTHPLSLHSPSGALSDEEIKLAILERLPASHRTPDETQVVTGTILAEIKGHFVVDARGQRFAVRAASFTYVIEVEVTERSMTLHRYAGEGAALEIASQDFEFGGGGATLAFVRSGGSVTAYLRSEGGLPHLIKIGDSPERRFEPVPSA